MKTLLFLTFYVCTIAYSRQECNTQNDCQKCIQTPGCAWTLDPKIDDKNRCISNNQTTSKSLYNPQSSITVTEKKPIGDTVAFTPQKAKLELRTGQTVSLLISLDKNDAFAPPHFPDVIVEVVRNKPDKVVANIDLVSCPTDPKKYDQTLQLRSYQSQQVLTLDVHLFCDCAADSNNND